MFDEINLGEEQIGVFTLLVEAARRVPRDKRAKFLFVETFAGSSIIHSGLPEWSLNAYKGDIELLAQNDFLLLSYTSRGSIQFEITPRGFKYYDERQSDPVDRVTRSEKMAIQFYGLNGSEKEILRNILISIQSTGSGIDATLYRAQHDDQLDTLDKLERNGFLRKDLDRYWVSLSGLRLLDDENTKTLSEKFEKVFDVLKRQYKASPKSKVMVADIAKLSSLTYRETAECLGYMVQVPWVGAYTNTLDNPSESYVQPSEDVLRHKRFKDISLSADRLRSEMMAQPAFRGPAAIMPMFSQPSNNKVDQTTNLSIVHPNKEWVIRELERIIDEWVAWSKEVDQIVDQPYDCNTHSEVYADGESMMQKHEVLQSKTLVFLVRNVRGHNFIAGFDGTHVDGTDLRLKHRVKHRLQELRVLRACLNTIQAEENTEPESAVKASATSATQKEILQLKPTFFGIGIDLKALWRMWQSKSDK